MINIYDWIISISSVSFMQQNNSHIFMIIFSRVLKITQSNFETDNCYYKIIYQFSKCAICCRKCFVVSHCSWCLLKKRKENLTKGAWTLTVTWVSETSLIFCMSVAGLNFISKGPSLKNEIQQWQREVA